MIAANRVISILTKKMSLDVHLAFVMDILKNAIEIKAKAEAEQMAKKADAWKEYQEAALVDMMLQARPLLTISTRSW